MGIEYASDFERRVGGIEQKAEQAMNDLPGRLVVWVWTDPLMLSPRRTGCGQGFAQILPKGICREPALSD